MHRVRHEVGIRPSVKQFGLRHDHQGLGFALQPKREQRAERHSEILHFKTQKKGILQLYGVLEGDAR